MSVASVLYSKTLMFLNRVRRPGRACNTAMCVKIPEDTERKRRREEEWTKASANKDHVARSHAAASRIIKTAGNPDSEATNNLPGCRRGTEIIPETDEDTAWPAGRVWADKDTTVKIPSSSNSGPLRKGNPPFSSLNFEGAENRPLLVKNRRDARIIGAGLEGLTEPFR
ncbi:hypothetical protein EAG_07197 [Camponotus floridanus]|uniref:Uncharacterized protein n=1 Tax=Camponotus floridanus TaxID=104421 RepID=E2ASC0_CAMFO|nr:hypothetical protein EAG_07197 [Camponotus floridanus]